jgi:hypothetical protein
MEVVIMVKRLTKYQDEVSKDLYDTEDDACASEHMHIYHMKIVEEVFIYISEHPDSSTMAVMDNHRSHLPSLVMGALHHLYEEDRICKEYDTDYYYGTWAISK